VEKEVQSQERGKLMYIITQLLLVVVVVAAAEVAI